MAIYQISFRLIPAKGLAEQFGTIPKRFTTVDEDYSKLMKQCWSTVEIEPLLVVKAIDRCAKREDTEPSYYSWKMYTDNPDNDANMTLDESTGKIEEVYFRADIREKGLVFLRQMTAMAKKYNLLLLDEEWNVCMPDQKYIVFLIKKSSALNFATIPV
jgi:hypothetical protein